MVEKNTMLVQVQAIHHKKRVVFFKTLFIDIAELSGCFLTIALNN
ncbi:hypothetical protein HBZS_114320 [Helicobacter bizzozeronii CCUG 35545]|nr:hypothetical protein HBZS_114320 [Helicobacter bizzozeronii CCUG 35545]